MKKYLISGMAAIVFCGAFTSCSHDLDNGGDSTKSTVEETYEKAFITHFGEPDSTQTWGFGASSAKAGTRGAVAAPTEIGPSFNATLAAMSGHLAAAISTGTDVDTYFSDYKKYQSWWNSNWNDTFYQIPALETVSTYSDEYLTQIRDIILEQIPEGGNNLTKATSTGYSITTTGGPVTLTPVYHFSNSGDKISYYYYPENENPTVDQIKAMPKYTIGNMANPEVCKGENEEDQRSFYKKTFTLVYVNEAGEAFDEFPAGYKINFIIQNTWAYNGNLTIYQSGGETVADPTPEPEPTPTPEPEPTPTPEPEPTPTPSGDLVPGQQLFKYEVPENKTYFCGEYAVGNPYSQYFVRFGNNGYSEDWQWEWRNDSYNDFVSSQRNPIDGYDYYSPGNTVNGSLEYGTTVYYIKYKYNSDDGGGRSDDEFMARVGIKMNGTKYLHVVELDSPNATSGTDVEGYENGKYYSNSFEGVIEFRINQGKTYAIYASGSKLGFYGCEVLYENSKRSSARTRGTRTVTDIVTAELSNNPEYYGDGRLNAAIHNSGLTQWNLPDSKGYDITDPETPHVAVFSIGDKNYIGFEDWKDFDYNDVIFEVTGTEGGEEIPVDPPVDDSDAIVVIAEDLTIDDARPDFDFNDVVFKVTRYAEGEKAGQVWVDVLAAGGTLPLYIGGTSGTYTDGKEVHAAFAEMNPDKVITTGTMVNTYAGRHDQYKTPSFQVTNYSGSTIEEIAGSIIVAVKKFGEFIELKAPTGGVPSKIAVKPDFLTDPNMGWCDERQDIDDKYNVDGKPLFKSYVKGELGDGWYREINPKKYQ